MTKLIHLGSVARETKTYPPDDLTTDNKLCQKAYYWNHNMGQKFTGPEHCGGHVTEGVCLDPLPPC